MRRSEAYPTIRRRPRLPGLPRLAALAAAIGVAALVLFMLPALLGIGGGGTGSGSPSPSAGHSASPTSDIPTVKPGPTPQVYVVKKGDNMSRIARQFGVTIEEIMAANPDIKNPNTIAQGQQIIIPAPTPADASPAATPKATLATPKATAKATKKP